MKRKQNFPEVKVSKQFELSKDLIETLDKQDLLKVKGGKIIEIKNFCINIVIKF